MWFGTLTHFLPRKKIPSLTSQVKKYYRMKMGMYIFLGRRSHVASQTQSRQYSIFITLGIGGFKGKVSS